MSAVEPSDMEMDLVRMRDSIGHAIPALLVLAKRLRALHLNKLAAMVEDIVADLRDSIEGDPALPDGGEL